MTDPVLSVVVAVSRGPEFVEPLRRSLESQGVALEILLVRDEDAGHRHPCVKRNWGAAKARAPILAFLDDDVLVAPGWAKAVLAAFERGAAVVTGPSDIPYSQDHDQRAANAVVCSPFFSLKSALRNKRRERVRYWGVSLCNAAMTRAVFDAVGGFNEVAYYWVDDAEFFFLAEKLGFALWNEPGAAVAHHKRPVVLPMARHYLRQRFYAGLSTWSFPELYLRQIGVPIGVAALALVVLAPKLAVLLAAAASLALLSRPHGVALLAGTAANFLGFWAGLLAGPFHRLANPSGASYRRFRYRDRSRPYEGKEFRRPPRALLREVLPYRAWRPGAFPQWLIYFVTARCNARCPMCFYLDEIEDAKRDGELTAAEIARTARKIPKITYLSLSGGEPFLREDLAALVQSFVDGPDPACVSLPTNGSFPRRVEGVVDSLSRRNPGTAFDVHLSLDGPPEIHDRLRGQAATYEKVMETRARVAALAKRRPNVGVKFVVTCSRENEAALEPFLEELVASGADRVNLVPLHGNFRDQAMAVPLERYLALSKALARSLDRRGFRCARHRVFAAAKGVVDERLEGLLREGDLGRLCGAGRKIAVLGPYGDVLPCEPLRRPVGNLREAGFDLPAILAGERMRAFAEERLGPGKCHCNWGCAIGNAVAQDPSFYPALARRIVAGPSA